MTNMEGQQIKKNGIPDSTKNTGKENSGNIGGTGTLLIMAIIKPILVYS